ncbi:MAG TPA: hypothetical protein DCM86_18915 [Verrucomicrobiales bacterium]|nr:hypothetical protein [Verrucomicrobiales bacterium]
MNSPQWVRWMTVAGLGAGASFGIAAEAPPGGAAPSAGLVNDWLRDRSKEFTAWDIGGQFRARFEHRDGFSITGAAGSMDFRDHGADVANGYGLFRTKVHVGYAPADWARVFVEGRDSFTVEDDRSPRPENDRTDLHQAYLGLGNPKEFPVTIKVGRQELSYGDERLIGASDWNNIGRVFDAAKLRYEKGGFWVDAFSGRVIIPDDHNFNVANDYDWFSGVYASSRTLLPKQETQAYFLARNTGLQSPTALGAGLPSLLNGATPRDIYTVGTRMKSLPGALGAWDYSFEAAGQFGRFKETAAGASLEHRAFAGHAAGGYTFKETTMTPRVGLEYDYATGDHDATDGKHTTFENLFPTNHKFYGFMDFASLQNLHDLRLSASAKPYAPLLVTLDYHAFLLADTHDSFYTVAGARRGGLAATPGTGYGINPGYGNYVGSEVDLVATWTVKRFGTFQAGLGHFFTGDYIEQSLSSAAYGAADANWVYLQAVFNF